MDGAAVHHASGAMVTQRYQHDGVHVIQHLVELPQELGPHLGREATPKYAELEAVSVALQQLGNTPQAAIVANVVRHQVPPALDYLSRRTARSDRRLRRRRRPLGSSR